MYPHSVKHGGLTHSVKHGGKTHSVKQNRLTRLVENRTVLPGLLLKNKTSQSNK